MNDPNHKNPSPCDGCKAADPARRKFLARLSLAVGGIGALIIGVPVAGFVLTPFFGRKSQVWRSVGKAESFKIGETKAVTYEGASPVAWAGVTARSAAWLRRVDADTFVAFSLNCTHLGCPVRWLAEADLFMCPCHGGVYYKDGSVSAGPPPRPLPRYPVRVLDGDVQIQTAPIPVTAS